MCPIIVHKNIRTIAAVVQTEDMGLQYDYVTPEGAGTGFGTMGDWPAYDLCEITNEKLHEIQEAVTSKTATKEMLKGTDLSTFCSSVFEYHNIIDSKEYSKALLDILNIPGEFDGPLFGLCDAKQWELDIQFFTSIEDLTNKFKEEYVIEITAWELMDDDELDDWISRIDEGLQGIELIRYS